MLKRMLVIGCIVGMSAATNLAYAEKLIFATTESPPFIMVIDGKPAGMDVEVLREFAARNTLEIEIQLVPWKRAIEDAKRGAAAALFTLKKNAERMEYYIYPTEHLQVERSVIAAVKGRGKKITTLKDLQGAVVGITRGNTYGNEFEAATLLEKNESINDVMLVKKLIGRRHDYIAGDEIVLKYLAAQQGVQLETLYVLGEYSTYIAFSKTLGARGEELAKQFDETMRQMVQEGVVQSIREKYLQVK